MFSQGSQRPDPRWLWFRQNATRVHHIVAGHRNREAVVGELLRLARHAADTELTCGVTNPGVERGALDAATATRTHIDIGSRVRAVDRDNVGHVHDINDADGNCTV